MLSATQVKISDVARKDRLMVLARGFPVVPQ
jgi:hypothetical protein